MFVRVTVLLRLPRARRPCPRPPALLLLPPPWPVRLSVALPLLVVVPFGLVGDDDSTLGTPGRWSLLVLILTRGYPTEILPQPPRWLSVQGFDGHPGVVVLFAVGDVSNLG